jgi:hypothetical protein
MSYYLLCLLFNKIGEQEGGTGSAWKREVGWGQRGEMAQTMYAHMNKCKHNLKKELEEELKKKRKLYPLRGNCFLDFEL